MSSETDHQTRSTSPDAIIDSPTLAPHSIGKEASTSGGFLQRRNTSRRDISLDDQARTDESRGLVGPNGGHPAEEGGLWRVLSRKATRLVTPHRKVGQSPPLAKSLYKILTASWFNILLVFIPVSWALHFSHQQDTAIFITAFMAIIPLAKLLAFATEDISIRVGQTLGGLINATLGNAVELIVSIIALVRCELTIVQSSLVGSILSNILLVLGMCFFAGGTRFSEQGFLLTAAQLNSTLLTLSVIAVLLPGAFHLAVGKRANGVDPLSDFKEGQDILKMSHGVALLLLLIYGSYLVFQLWSHAHLYSDDAQAQVAPSTRYPVRNPQDTEANANKEEEEEEVEEPEMSLPLALFVLAAVTVLVAVTAEFLVASIDGLTEGGHISKEWVGLILLPIVGNAAEHVTAVTVSVKDKLDLSIGVAVGSSIQIALFVVPFITVLAWIMGRNLTLLFDPFESIVLFLSVLTVSYVLQDGKSNWLEGMVLMMLYVIIGTTAWFYPGNDVAGELFNGVCRTNQLKSA